MSDSQERQANRIRADLAAGRDVSFDAGSIVNPRLVSRIISEIAPRDGSGTPYLPHLSLAGVTFEDAVDFGDA